MPRSMVTVLDTRVVEMVGFVFIKVEDILFLEEFEQL